MPDQYNSKLGAYLDGQLDRRQVSELEIHLADCPACQAELAELRQLSELLRRSSARIYTGPRL
jgi:anti-sigma factor RsiW